MSAVEEVVEAIDGRIGVLREERGRLEAARRALRGEDPMVRTAPARGDPRPALRAVRREERRPRPRVKRQVPRGQRQAAAAALVEAKPGIATPEIAGGLGVQMAQAYKITRRLAEVKKIQGDNKGWYPLREA